MLRVPEERVTASDDRSLDALEQLRAFRSQSQRPPPGGGGGMFQPTVPMHGPSVGPSVGPSGLSLEPRQRQSLPPRPTVQDVIYDVVVVGCGSAGISAARVLQDSGLSVVVLEGRDRVGGRAHSAGVFGMEQELDHGASFLHASAEQAQLLAMADSMQYPFRFADQLGQTDVYDEEEQRLSRNPKQTPVLSHTARQDAELRKHMSQSAAKVAKGMDASAMDVLAGEYDKCARAFGPGSVSLRARVLQWRTKGTWRLADFRTRAALEDLSAAHWQTSTSMAEPMRQADASPDVEFPAGGMGGLLAALAEPLNVQLERAVEEIEYDDEQSAGPPLVNVLCRGPTGGPSPIRQ